MEMTDAKVVEKKIYEEGKKHDDYASKATGNAGLTLGIIGTALGAGAWLLGGNKHSSLKPHSGMRLIRLKTILQAHNVST